ncbi:MAG TPA: hypothetical protein VFU19_17175 [Iamia sp.]|nr:hypothetical protein [Iamia sp.]
MGFRPLLWIVVVAVVAGSVVPAPAPAVTLGEGWEVTMDAPPVGGFPSRTITISGTAWHAAARPDGRPRVVVWITPVDLPRSCGPGRQGAAELRDGRFAVTFEVLCNGRYRVELKPMAGGVSDAFEPWAAGEVAVAAVPPAPGRPVSEARSDGGVGVAWPATGDIDEAGTVLVVGDREQVLPLGTYQAVVPPEDQGAPIAIRTIRWGAGGPGTTVTSERSEPAAAEDPTVGRVLDDGWGLTIDTPATEVVASQMLTVAGTAVPVGVPGGDVQVTVRVVPQGLPPACGPPITHTTPARDGVYAIAIGVHCNGPHRIEVVAHAGASRSEWVTRAIGVAEPPPQPPRPPGIDWPDDGTVEVSWPSTGDIDAAGAILVVGSRALTLGTGTYHVVLPPENRYSAFSMHSIRWGADGPGGATLTSPPSGGVGASTEQRDQPPREPPPEPSPTTPQLGGGSPAPLPPTSSSDPTAESWPAGQGPSGAKPALDSDKTPPARPADESPVTEPGTSRRPRVGLDDRAAPPSPVGGVAHTSTSPPSPPVAPVAVGLVLATMVVQVLRLHRRTRSPG